MTGVSCQSSSECFTAATAYSGNQAPTSWSTPLIAGWNGRHLRPTVSKCAGSVPNEGDRFCVLTFRTLTIASAISPSPWTQHTSFTNGTDAD